MTGKEIVEHMQHDIGWGCSIHDVIPYIDTALAKARVEEREACEKIAMNVINLTINPPMYEKRPSYEFGRREAAGEIAIAIRARVTP